MGLYTKRELLDVIRWLIIRLYQHKLDELVDEFAERFPIILAAAAKKKPT